MEPTESKKPVASKKVTASNLRVKAETRKRILNELAKVNKKSFGRTVRPDHLLNLLLNLLKPEHIQKLQDESLSNADRLEIKFREHQKVHGVISKDEFLGRLLASETAKDRSDEAVLLEGKNLK